MERSKGNDRGRTEIEQRERKKRIEEEQEEWEESIVHGHHEIGNCVDEDNGNTCDHDQNWCAQALSYQTASCECYYGLDLSPYLSGLVLLISMSDGTRTAIGILDLDSPFLPREVGS